MISGEKVKNFIVRRLFLAELILAAAIICTVLISFAKADSANPLSVYLAEIGFDAKGLLLLS